MEKIKVRFINYPEPMSVKDIDKGGIQWIDLTTIGTHKSGMSDIIDLIDIWLALEIAAWLPFLKEGQSIEYQLEI